MSVLRPSELGTPFDVITAVRRVNKLLRARFDRALYSLALSYAQYEILLLLEQDANLHAAAIARELTISRQAVQRLLEALRLADLVEALPRDGGVVGLRITGAGRSRLRLARTALTDVHERLRRLPPEVRARLVEDLGSVEVALVRDPAFGFVLLDPDDQPPAPRASDP
jgi:DNA-binding MarR family transcriptional regulator